MDKLLDHTPYFLPMNIIPIQTANIYIPPPPSQTTSAASKPAPNQSQVLHSPASAKAVIDASPSAVEPPPSPFVDLIGSCFKPYLDIYTDSIDRSLADILERFVVDARTATAPTAATAAAATDAVVVGGGAGPADSPVYPSCADLFVFYKKCMVQCAQLSCGQPLLDLTAIFKRYLREYAVRLLEPRLHAASSSSSHVGGSSGSSAIGGGSAFAATSAAASSFGAIASSAAAAATSSTKDHLQQLTATAGNVLQQLLKEKDGGGGGGSSGLYRQLRSFRVAERNDDNTRSEIDRISLEKAI